MWSSSNYLRRTNSQQKKHLYVWKKIHERVRGNETVKIHILFMTRHCRVWVILLAPIKIVLPTKVMKTWIRHILIENISFYDSEVKTEIVKQLQRYLPGSSQSASVEFTVHKMNDNTVFVNCQSADTAENILKNSEHSIEVYGKTYSLTKCERVDREIIFIKYDPDNLKYLYLCSACTTSWKSQ